MSRRSVASLTAMALLAVTIIVIGLVPVPYVIFSPGPTVNLLGTSDKREIVQVGTGTKAYRDSGQLRLLTVIPTGPDSRVNLFEAMFAWASPSKAVYQYDDIYQPTDTEDVVQEQGQADMVSSQDAAVASALRELGYTFSTYVQVVGIQRGGPGDGSLEVRDRILSVNGVPTTDLETSIGQIRTTKPGEKVRVKVRRAGKDQTLKIKTVASPSDPKQSALLISVGPGYTFPVDVRVRVTNQIGGPSAGMMFALAIYDTLTPGSLTGGADVAGTGTMDPDGTVGPIGGIQQKLVAAQRAGAKLFLAPADNCDEVRGGPYDADKMRVVKISTFPDAVKDVEAWRKNHDAKLPTC